MSKQTKPQPATDFQRISSFDPVAFAAAKAEAQRLIDAKPGVVLASHSAYDDNKGGSSCKGGPPDPCVLSVRQGTFSDAIRAYQPAFRCPACYQIFGAL